MAWSKGGSSGGGGGGGAGKKSAAGGAATIAPGEVAAFTKDSLIRDLLIHRTTDAGKKAILAGGIDPAKNRAGALGAGLYTSVASQGPGEARFGRASVRVVVDARKVLSGTQKQISARRAAFEAANPGPTAAGFSASLRARGYDAIRVRVAPGKTWVVILNPAAARIVK